MKKIILCLFTIIIIGGIVLFFSLKDDKKDSKETKVTVAEVAHSVFYAPQYVADALGYFEDEDLDVDIVLTAGADAVTAAVLSGDVDIGFCGTEATIYVYNGGEKDYLKTFAGLTKRDGSFIVSRKSNTDFKLDDLKGSYVIGGRAGGMPEMTFEWALRENGINPKSDLTIDTSIAFAAMQGAFIGGTGDYVTLFEPNATAVEKAGFGHIVAYVGELGGEVPYTAYNARKSFINKNPKTIKSFSTAINKGLKYVMNHDSKDIANVIVDYFPDTSLNDLVTIIDRYKKGDVWKSNITINKKEWNHIQDIISAAGELNEKVSYDKLIESKYFEDYE